MGATAMTTAGSQPAIRRAARLARDLSQTAAHVVELLDADLVAAFEVAHPGDLDALIHLVAEAAESGPVVVTVTRPSATTAP